MTSACVHWTNFNMKQNGGSNKMSIPNFAHPTQVEYYYIFFHAHWPPQNSWGRGWIVGGCVTTPTSLPLRGGASTALTMCARKFMFNNLNFRSPWLMQSYGTYTQRFILVIILAVRNLTLCHVIFKNINKLRKKYFIRSRKIICKRYPLSIDNL